MTTTFIRKCINQVKCFFRQRRRNFYHKYKMDYINKSISLRKGYCKCCPCCAVENHERLFSKQCENFNPKTKLCMKHKDKKIGCKSNPFDYKDMSPFQKRNCGYYWDKKS